MSNMTGHYFENDFVKLHYYKFGTGPKHMLTFHGFGMHGRQFRILESVLGDQYTFWGFDLFFHERTILKDESLQTIKAGMQKAQLADLISDFCADQGISQFSVLGYSMGSHFATVLVEQMPERIVDYIIAAPSSIEPGTLIRFFGGKTIGNRILEKMTLSGKAMIGLINFAYNFRFIDKTARDILYKEIGTPRLRFALYACFTYLRFFETKEHIFIANLRKYNIRSIFIFGSRDKMYLPKIGRAFFKKLPEAEVVILDSNHEMIKAAFAAKLTELLT